MWLWSSGYCGLCLRLHLHLAWGTQDKVWVSGITASLGKIKLPSSLSDTFLWVLCGLGSCVELNRSAFLEPEGLSKARKSVFITRKLTVSVGEVVNGGLLPPVPRHTPVCSFNSQNKYVGESLATELPVSTQKPSLDTSGE